MIGVTCQDGRGAIDLFGKEDADKLMWEGCRPEAQLAVAGQQRRVKPVGTTDRKDQTGNTPVASVADHLGKSHAGLARCAFVQQPHRCTGRDSRQKRCGFLTLPLLGYACRALINFDEGHIAEPYRPRSGFGTLDVALQEIPFRAGLHAADGENEDLHSGEDQPVRRSLGRSVLHIFSRL